MTLITKSAEKRLRFLLSLVSIILCINSSYGENDLRNGSKRLIPALEVSSTLPSINVPASSFVMEDTVCTSIIQDTFYVNSLPFIDTYSWTVPTGANITSTIGDTMIIVDWTNAVSGLGDICLETMNNCGTSTPTCFPIRVLVCNEMPQAVDDVRSTPANVAILIDVQENDSDLDNDPLTTGLDLSDSPANGTVTIINNDIQYTPNPNFTGVDEFQYFICDNGNPMFCDTAKVTVTVENSPPTANPDEVSTLAGTPVTIPVQDNDTDPENNDLVTSLNPNTPPTQGTVTINGDDIIYTPSPTATGSDEFGYIICDNGNPSKCDTSIVTVNFDNQAPIAVDDRDTTLSNQAILLTVQNNDSDPENNDLTTILASLTPPTAGTVAVIGANIQYTPNTNFTGTDNFEYIICDDGTPSKCDTARVDVVVLNEAPVAVNDLTATQSGVPITIPVQDNDKDRENGVLTTTLDPSNSPTNGTMVVNGIGIIYTPGTGFSGTDSFNYIICDDGNPILCDTATVTISTENQPPIAVADTYVTPFETAIRLDVQDNDTDPENGLLVTSLNPSFPPTNGTVSILNGDSLLYTPATNFIGTDQFGYIICDNGIPSLCDTTTVTVTVPNDRPIAMDDSNTTLEDIPVNGTILGNDMDPNGHDLVLNLILISSPENGTINLNPDGSYTYTPSANYHGTDAFTYQICDGQTPNLCDTAEVLITILPVNDAPIALDDTNTTSEETPVNGSVLPNDTDVENNNLTVSTTPVDQPDNGTLTLNPDGTYTYTPNPNFEGTDSFQYEVCDDGSPTACDTAIVTITVNPVNDPPMAMDDPFTTDEDMPVTGNLLSNDTDPDNDDLTVSTTPVDQPDNGTLILNPDGTFTYTPDPNFEGTDTFQYEVCDDGTPPACDTATVTITVNPINDAPIATDDGFPLEEDMILTGDLLINDSDPDNDPITVTTIPVEDPTNGSVILNSNGTFTYVPNPAFNGRDTFQYEICDNATPKLCNTAQVVIAIDPENDPPVAVDDIVVAPVNEPAMGNLLTNDFDPEGNNITVNTTPVEAPENGILTINPDGTYTYTPDPNFVGEDSFQYEICDDGIPQTCDTATVVIYIIEDNSGVNDPPVAVNDNFVTDVNKPIIDVNLLTNDVDPDGDDLILNTAPINQPSNGTVFINPNGNATYTPTTDFIGEDVFTYRICDNGIPILCDTATVNITILPAALLENSTYANDDAGLTYQDVPLMGILNDNDNDPEGDTQILQTTPITNPSNGTVTLNPDGTFEYVPNPSYVGADLFVYQLCDDGTPVACDEATVYLTVLVRNTAPYAIDDVNVIPKNGMADGDLLANDFDLDGDNIVVNTTPIGTVENGALMINPDGTYTYSPNTDFVGEDVFTYQICDDGLPVMCDTATVTIEIVDNNLAVNDPPVGVNDVFVTLVNTNVVSDLIGNDFDPDGDNITINTTPTSQPDNGTVTINADGTFEYIPDPNFTGDDYFKYQICDDQTPSLCTEATVSITMIPASGINLTFANDDVANTTEDMPVSGDLLANDTDPEGHTQTINPTPTVAPENGIVIINLDGTYTYTPNPDYFGADQFTYIVCDNGTPSACDEAAVRLNILPENDPPVAIDDILVTATNEPAMGDLLANDFDVEDDEVTLNTTPVDEPDNGTVNINPDGTYTYTPDPNFAGEDSFQYEICDNGMPQRCDTATVVIYIINDNIGVNDAPIAINDNFVTNANAPIIDVNLLTNDVDPDGDMIAINVTPINPPSNGIIGINANGFATYTPATDFIGTDEFTYQICDDATPSLCDTATVNITILPAINTPNSTYANDDAGITYQDVPLTGILNDNDNDPEGDNQFLQTMPITNPSNGTVTLNPNGTFEYVPNPSYVGADLFVYQLCDDGTPVACDEATVYLTVLVRNTAPYAIDDINVIPKNGMADGDLLANDFDLDGGNISVNTTPIETVDNGTLTINPDGTYTYSPDTDFVGEDVFTYQICDDGLPVMCDTATVTIEIVENNLAVNDPPVGVNDVFVTLVNTNVVSDLIGNDFDPDGDNIAINTTPTSQPENGTVTINPNGIFEYIPDANFTGDDYFKYQICDDQTPSLCTEATVSITMIPTSDINFTFANDDVANTTEDTPVSGDLLANDTDPEGHNQTINPTPTVAPENGTVTINLEGTYTYTPKHNYFGADQFTYTVCDNGTPSACDEAVVRINIQSIQDGPIAKDDINFTLENTPVAGLVLTNDTDPEGDDLIVNTTPLKNPENGTVVLNADGTYTYTPALDFSGEDNFTYVVCADQLPVLCDTAIVSIKVIGINNPENNPPVGLDDVNFGLVNTPVSGNLIANDNDPDGDPFNITTTPISTPTNGTVIINPNGTYTYTPNPDFIGEDIFEYEICDLGNPVACDTARVKIEIFPNSGNTVFANDDAAIGQEDSPILGDLLANDFDPEGNNILLNIFPTKLPQHGTVTLNPNGSFSYFPVADYNGTDQFEYEICDDGTPVACNVATAYLTILPVADTLCAEALPKPTLLSSGAVCFTDDIHLFIQENYPLFTIENTDLDFEFTWFNSLGDTIATTTEPNFTIDANDPMAVSPFTVKVKLEDCISDFADPISVDITQLPTVIATATSGSQGVCVNGSTQLMATTVEGATYIWRVAGDVTIIATEQNPVINNILTTTTYEVQVKPALCEVFTTASITVIVNGGPIIAPEVASGSLVCLGSSFQLESNANGIAPLTYNWTGPDKFTSNAANPIISNASLDNSGTYTVEVTDANGCSNRVDLTVDAISAGPEQPLTNNNSPVCIDGIININLQTPYTGNSITYNWINGLGNTVSTDRNLNLAANDVNAISPFFLQVTIDGCQSPNSALITIDVQDKPIALATSANNTICTGGEIQLFGNAVASATYEWRLINDPTILSTLQNPIFRNIQQDTAYTLTVRSGVCPDKYSLDTISISVSPKADFTPSKIYSLNEDCSVSDLQLNANVIGSTANLTYQWSGPNAFSSTEANPTIPNVTDAFNGAYSLTITNQSGCATTKTIFINDLQGNLPKPVITALNTGCTSDNIILEAPIYEGNNLVYTWLRNNLAIGSNSPQLFIDDARNGVQYKVVIQVNGCIIESDNFRPLVFDQPTVVIAEHSPTLCTDGNADITLNATIAGGQAPYEIVWTSTTGFQSFNEDATIINATEALSGTYSIEIIDQNGCIAKASTDVDIKEAPTQPIVNFNNPVCEGAITTLSASNYEGVNVNYSWQVPDTTNISGLNSSELLISSINQDLHQGQYTLSVEIDGCVSTSDPINLEVIQLPTIQPVAIYTTTIDCAENNLNLRANLASNTNNVTFEWTGPNGFISNAENPVIVNATEANNGQYFLKITNNAGCVRSESTNVIDNIKDGIAQPTIQGTTTLCEGETIQLTAPIYTGGSVTYYWFFNDGLIPNANNFELLIPQATTAAHQGNYNVLVEVDGCQRSATPVAINLLPIPIFNPQAIYARTENCTGSNLALRANIVGSTTGLTFAWSGPNGYTSNVENPVIVNATAENNGQYTLLVTNSNNCWQHLATNVIEDISPVLPQPIIQTSKAVCEGGIMTLTAPVYTGTMVNYTWLVNGDTLARANTSEITIGPLENNGDVYQVEVTVDDCKLMSEEIIPNVLPMGKIAPTYELSGICEGNTLQLRANKSSAVGTITYQWTGPNGYISNAENPFIGNTSERFNGTYTLTISTLAGCETSESFTISEIIDEPVQPTVITNGTVCVGEMINLSVQETSTTNSATYSWLNGQNDTIGKERAISIAANDPLAISPYKVNVTHGSCGSISSIPVRVTILDIQAFAVNNSGPVCQGSEVQLMTTALENATYTWTDAETGTIVSTLQNPTILNIDTTTTFNLTVQIAGCDNSSTVATTVIVKQRPTITNLSPTLSICDGQDLMLTATNGNPMDQAITYTWTGPNGFNFTNESTDNTFPVTIPSFSASQVGAYQLTIGGMDNCASESRSVVVGLNDELITATLAAATNLVCGGEAISLTASTENGPNVSYEWYLQTELGDLLLIRETATPTMIISNASSANSGEYLVRIIKGACVSGYSNTAEITVLDATSNIMASNNTDEAAKICEGGVIQLAVPFFEGATYTWFGPAGYTSDKANPIISPATTLAAGDYFAIISIDGCTGITSSVTTVFVNPQPTQPTIINNGPICSGETLILEVSSELGFGEEDDLVYEWYDAFSNALIRSTTESQLILTNAAENQSGHYYLQLIANGCKAAISNETEVDILSAFDLIADAGDNQFLCAASTVNLTANPITNGMGVWSSPTGATIADPALANTTASNLQAGINQFIWAATSNQCATQSSDTLEIDVEMVPVDVAFAGLYRDICETDAVTLTATPLTNALGTWTQSVDQIAQGIIITDPTSASSSIDGLEPGNTYTFVWTISEAECPNFATDTVQLSINDMPADNALVREESIILCDEDQLTLNAEIPTFSMGQWFTESGATIANPTNPSTFAENLDPGENVFIWALSNGACENYSTDTVIVHSERMPMINADAYEINLNDTLDMNVLENDVISANMAIRFVVTKYPDNGELIEGEDGILTYKPQSNFFGFDNFRYKVCSQLCESLCDTAIVTIGVTGTQGSGECLIPNVISPNDDGNNDYFLVSCLDQFPDNELKIFNRWGDKVYETRNYQNDWAGTHNRLPLPAGTYFYMLKLSEDGDPLQGFITIFR